MDLKFTNYEDWTRLPPNRYIGYQEAKDFVHGLELKVGQWSAYFKGNIAVNKNGKPLPPLPSSIPIYPWVVYHKEYEGMEKWLLSPERLREYWAVLAKKEKENSEEERKIKVRKYIKEQLKKYWWAMFNDNVWNSLRPTVSAEDLMETLGESPNNCGGMSVEKSYIWRSIKDTIFKEIRRDNQDNKIYDVRHYGELADSMVDSFLTRGMAKEIRKKAGFKIIFPKNIPMVFDDEAIYSEILEYKEYQKYLRSLKHKKDS